MTLPGDTILDGPDYQPKRIRVCNNDGLLNEAETKSNQDSGIEFSSYYFLKADSNFDKRYMGF